MRVLGIQLHPKDHKKDYEFANFSCQSTLKSFDKHSGANHFSVLRLPPLLGPARKMWMCFEPPQHQVVQTFLFGKTT